MRFGSLVFCLHALVLFLFSSSLNYAQGPREQKLRRGLHDTELVGAWIYDDLDAGFSEAERTGKPLLVVFR